MASSNQTSSHAALSVALQALQSGNLAASEFICRDILDQAPNDSAALNVLGVIAARIGAFRNAEKYFRQSIRAERNNGEARANLERLKQIPPTSLASDGSPKYLLIKAWGFGFWSDVSQVLGSLLLAEITGRTPITQWGTNSLFNDGSAEDAFEIYFRPVSGAALESVAAIQNPTFFPSKWTADNLMEPEVSKWSGAGSRAAALYFLNRPETIAVSDFYTGVLDVYPWIPPSHCMYGKPVEDVYRYLIGKYLQPREATLAGCETIIREKKLQSGKFAAVHIRGSDKVIEIPDSRATHESSLIALRSVDPEWPVFLLTDDDTWLERFRAMFGERVVFTDAQRTKTSTGVHHIASVNRVKAGQEVMIDTYVALRSGCFIGDGRSNVSAMISLMKKWKAGQCRLICRSQLLERNLFIHLPR